MSFIIQAVKFTYFSSSKILLVPGSFSSLTVPLQDAAYRLGVGDNGIAIKPQTFYGTLGGCFIARAAGIDNDYRKIAQTPE